MFDFVRSHTRLLQGVLVLLVFPSFVFFGVQGYSHFMDQAAATVATVDGQPIRQSELEAAHRQQVERMRQQMPTLDVKLFDTPEARQQTLDALVREQVLRHAAQKENLVVPDLRLQRLFVTDPAYAALRKPDGSVNKDYLAAQGMSVGQFEEMLRTEYSLRQVLAGVTGSSLSGQTVAAANANALLEQREVQVQRFEAKDYLAKVNPSDADIDAFYKAHADLFRAPDEASIEYVVLDLDALKKQVTVSDDDLKKYYEQNISRYTVPEERRASHILIAVDKDAAADVRAKAKAKAESLLAEVKAHPDSFAEVAKKNSQDPGSAAKGGDLDFFARGAMVKPFEDAAFGMKVNEISGVVESDFGYHIIKLTAVRGGDRKPFEAVRAEIQDEVAKQLAQQRYAEAAEQFSNLVYEQSDSLQPVIDKLKLSKMTAVVQRAVAPGATGPLASSKLLDAVFSVDALQNKRNTEAVETGANQLVSARVVSYRPAHVRDLAEVRPQVLEQLKADQAAAAARKEGEARLATLKQNPADTLAPSVVLSRAQIQGQPRQVVDATLKADLAKGPVVVGVDLGAQGYAVVKVVKRVPRAGDDADLARAKPYIAQALTQAEEAAYYDALKRRHKVEIKQAGAPAASASAASN
ncbi:SurA N-terminal domain-containing protein [Ideonella sp. B508-1]|uniref:SurA N-terminal domain-containing protein n=1 Tax=Ideonella sp. B508-1 TaxID=137716 RepID=UPI000346A68B|nr:SurA N-terminal domain-containing protein [Ideonella sp. B508-1]